jgi:aldehyde dehydrogenase (NAD+)
MSVTELFDSLPYGPAPESADLASQWLDQHERKFGLFIGGRWVKAEEGFETLNPSNGRPLATIAQAGPAEVDTAVEAARKAQEEWWKLGPHGRARHLYALARQVQKHARLLAVLESIDNGKPIRETRDIDIPLVARHFYHHAGWAQLMAQEFPGAEPVGVAGQIIPWNFPLLMLAWKIAPAIAMGNTVVLKPAEYTSLTALAFAELCERAGLPPGVVNIVTGDGRTGKLMVEHAGIDKIAFTGSTDVGRIIREATAGSGKKLSLELGGKSPFIVFEDADVDSAVEGLVDAIWFNQGQVCCAGSRLLVQEGVADRVLRKVRERMEKLRVGDPLDKAVDIGAIIAPVQLDRITELVTKGEQEGASLFQPSWACPQEGWFYPPTLLTNVSPSSTVAQVEIFGPVLVAMTFRTPKEAVELANNTTYGLAASVWTENVGLALDIAAKVKAGTVWVNCTNQFDASSGFGGYRESGYGREGGREGLWEYLKLAPEPQPELTVKWPAMQLPKLTQSLDKTHKQYIGGKQVRPDSGYSHTIQTRDGSIEVARGNRKDVRNAVEAARAAQPAWAAASAFNRAQVLYYLAENLEAHRAELEQALEAIEGDGAEQVQRSVEQVFRIAAFTDKHEGAVHEVPMRALTYTRNEPIGVVGVVCPPGMGLLGLLSLALPAIAVGNAVVALPSDENPLPAVELYRILDASDVPAGVFNILTGPHEDMVPSLVDHDGIDAIWHFGSPEQGAEVERRSTGNLKQTWTTATEKIHWTHLPLRELFRRSTQVKNIWVPYGD